MWSAPIRTSAMPARTHRAAARFDLTVQSIAPHDRRPTEPPRDRNIPFWETNEKELEHYGSRPRRELSTCLALSADSHFSQVAALPCTDRVRLAIAFFSSGPLHGVLNIALYESAIDLSPTLDLDRTINATLPFNFEFLSVDVPPGASSCGQFERMEVSFTPAVHNTGAVIVHALPGEGGGAPCALMRLFASDLGHCRA
jgi:hypothetical protein